MIGDRRIGALLALTFVLALGACTSAGSDMAPAADTETRAPAVPAAATGVFTGSMRCRETTPTPAGADPDKAYATCEVSARDPRLSGTDAGSTAYEAPEDAPYVIAWGESTLSNDAGSWLCTHFISGATNTANSTGTEDRVCTGLGDYIGLTAYMHGVSGNMGTSVGFLAWIVPTP